jgi:hypothetical protein
MSSAHALAREQVREAKHQRELTWPWGNPDAVRAQRPKRLLPVLSPSEVQRKHVIRSPLDLVASGWPTFANNIFVNCALFGPN